MMTCEEVIFLILTDYPDQEIDDQRRELLEEHLDTCPKCRSLAAEVSGSVVRPLREVSSDHLSREDIWLRIRDKVGAADARGPARSRFDLIREWPRLAWPGLSYGIGFAALLLLAGVMLLRPFPGGRSPVVYESEVIEELLLAAHDDGLDQLAVEGLGTDIEMVFYD